MVGALRGVDRGVAAPTGGPIRRCTPLRGPYRGGIHPAGALRGVDRGVATPPGGQIRRKTPPWGP